MQHRARGPGIRRKPWASSKLAWLQERLGKFFEQAPRQFSEGERLPSRDHERSNFYQSPSKKERSGESRSPQWTPEMPAYNQRREINRVREPSRSSLPWNEEKIPPYFQDPYGWDLDMRLWDEREVPPWASTNPPNSRSHDKNHRRETSNEAVPYRPEEFYDWEFMPPPPMRRNQGETSRMSRPSISPIEVPKRGYEEMPSSYDETEQLARGQVKRYSSQPAHRRIKRRRRYQRI